MGIEKKDLDKHEADDLHNALHGMMKQIGLLPSQIETMVLEYIASNLF